MTKEKYLELCEMMGTEPLEEEIPVEFDDLIPEMQEALHIYNNLQDTWDYMGGNYTGKNLTGITGVMDIYEIAPEDRRYIYEFIILIDKVRAKSLKDAKDKKPPK